MNMHERIMSGKLFTDMCEGNPCRVIREIGSKDMEYYYRDRRIDPEDLKEEARLRES